MPKIEKLSPDFLPDILELIRSKITTIENLIQDIDQDIILSNLKPRLQKMLEKDLGYGFFKKESLNAYLIGHSLISNLKGKEKGAYIPFWGFSFPKNNDEIFIQLYQKIAKEWIKKGMVNHLITYSPAKRLFEQKLYWLGFGMLVIDAIRPIELITTKPFNSDFVFRPMTNNDYQKIVKMERHFSLYLKSSPTFLYTSNNDQTSPPEDYITNSKQTIVAEYRGKLIAAIRGKLGDSNFDLLKGDINTMAIDYAYTKPAYRGMGVGKQLVNEILIWGKENKAKRCTVDFESANLLASRFWLNYFSPLTYNAIRKIDSRFRS